VRKAARSTGSPHYSVIPFGFQASILSSPLAPLEIRSLRAFMRAAFDYQKKTIPMPAMPAQVAQPSTAAKRLFGVS